MRRGLRLIVSAILEISLVAGVIPGGIAGILPVRAEENSAIEDVSLTDSQRITYNVPGGTLYFEADTGTIAWAEGDMEELTIPDSINGTEVKLIGRWKLSGLKKLKKLNLPKGKNILGEGSLAELTALQEFTVPDSCDTIPKQCFSGCTSLKKVSMPKTITSIGESAFFGCSSLEYADIPGNCLSIGKMAFYNCTGLKGVAFAEGSECNATAWGIFYNCKSLEKAVNIPGMRFKIFYESGKRAEKWLSEDGMKEKQTEMWRLKYGTESDEEKWIEGEELAERENAIRELALEITKDCKTDRAKIEAVMQWVDDKLSYDRGHDNHPWAIYNGIKDMEAGKKAKQYNSCGGYSNMTQVLLQSLGIPCATFWRKNLNGEPMDHEFCAAYFEGKWRWLDTTHSDGREEGLELGMGTPSFFYDSDHRVDYMLYRSGKGESIYKELSLGIPVEEDEKDWVDQNPGNAYTAAKAPKDPDWEHEVDPNLVQAEKDKIKARDAEFPKDIEESSAGLFKFDKTTGTITGIKDKTVTRINIPEKIDGVTVRAIGGGDIESGDGGLQGISKLEYLTMPDTIEEIGKYAFANNPNLKRVHLSSEITELKEGTFQNDVSLETVTIPAKVKRLDKNIFRNCDSLEEALFEDYDFKIKVIETDPLGSDNYYEREMADISWYCFAGMSGRALHGLDFHETYTGTKYHRQLQALDLTDNWRDNIVKIHQSQRGYREGFSPYHLDGSNSREFILSPKAVDYEWGHFAEPSRFTGYQPATWCRAFIDWDYAMAGVYGYKSTEYKWKDTVYAGGTVELEPGDMLGMGKSHWCMVGSVKELDNGTVEMWIIHGNHSDRKVMDEVLHYNRKTGKALDVEDDDYDEFRAIYKIDFSDIKTQTVALNPGEGTCRLKNRVYSEGAYYGCLPDAERDGYVFEGWYTEPDGKGLRAYPYRNLTDDVDTLYAYYTENPKAVKGVKLDKESITLKPGEEVKLNADVLPSNAENKEIDWRSGNFEVASVNNGVVKGIKKGNVTILARTKGGPYVAYCEVKVLGENGEEEEEEEEEAEYVTYAVAGGNITFNKKTGTVTKADKTVTEAEIPSEIDGVKVKAIGKEAFYQCKSLTKVILPEGLEKIGQSAFEETAISSVCIPDSVKRIEKWAFVVNDNLQYVIIGKGVEYISTWAFTSNKNLKNVYFRSDWKNIEIGDQAFGGKGEGMFKLYDEKTDPPFIVIGGSGNYDPGKKKVPFEEGSAYASPTDNFAPVCPSGKTMDNAKITKLLLDFSKVKDSDIAPDALSMTVIKGTKFTTVQKVKEGSDVTVSSKKIKCKVNKKTGKAAITVKGEGTLTFTLEDDITYTVNFAVETPKAQKQEKKMAIADGEVTKTLFDLFKTTIDSGTLTVVKDKKKQARVSENNILCVRPAEKNSIKVRYKYFNKKYNITIKVK